MRNKIKNGMPAFLAIGVFALIEIINIFDFVPEHQRYNFEIMSNILMLIVAAVGFFLMGFPPSSDSGRSRGEEIFSNIVVSAMAFAMNIDVFEHTLRRDHILEDLWGWHTCWVICTVLQMILLTGFGKAALYQIKMFLMKIGRIGKALETFFSGLWSMLTYSKGRFLFVVFGIAIWGAFFANLCRDKSASDILSDMGFWANSVLLWIYYFAVITLVYVLFHVFPKLRAAIQNASGKTVMAITLIFIIAILSSVLSSLLKVLATIILIPASVTGSVWFAVNKINTDSNSANDEGVQGKEINSKDVLLILLCFLGLPLTFIFLMTFLGTDGKSAIVEDPTSFTAWLEFINTVADVARTFFGSPR